MAKRQSPRRSGDRYAQTSWQSLGQLFFSGTLDKAPRRKYESAISNSSLGFEILEDRRMLAADYGDAPDPYATILADDGARHEAVGLQLGALRTTEVDAIPSSLADSDSGDDGVTFGTIRIGQLQASVTVNVQNLAEGSIGRLDAWIDFNGDGSWSGADEKVFVSQEVVVGDNVLEFDVPSGSKPGETTARLRLSTDGVLRPLGYAPDGEVEDYQIVITAPNIPGELYEFEQTFTDQADGASDVQAVDLDGDGDMDIVTASFNDATVMWFENDGNQNFIARPIASGFSGLRSIFVTDVDSDGDLDVLAASYQLDRISWFDNIGGEIFVNRTIAASADGAQSVYAADVDSDGDLDVLAAAFLDNEIILFQNNGNNSFTKKVISSDAGGASSVFSADVDGDGDLDILSASYNDDEIAWYENDGFQDFTEHLLGTVVNGAYDVKAVDMDGDGDMDIVSAAFSDGLIIYHENDGNQNFLAHTIVPHIGNYRLGVRSVVPVDYDGDGHVDILSATYFGKAIGWYKNNGNEEFEFSLISSEVNGATKVHAADLDLDGDLDILAAAYLDDQFLWYRNDFGVSFAASSPSIEEGSGLDLTYTFQLNQSLSLDTMLPFTISGSALLGTDYLIQNAYEFDGLVGIVKIPAGSTSVQLDISIVDDTFAEFEETIIVTLGEGNYIIQGESKISTELVSDEYGLDLGDAPAPYTTSIEGGAAGHFGSDAGSPILGSAIDFENEQQSDNFAEADLYDDGVSFGTIRVGALDATVTVNVQGGAGKLDAWIDFNGDGYWGGPGEKIFTSHDVFLGENELTFEVPSWAIVGDTYARFRVSEEGGLGLRGVAQNGEVEDYLVSINTSGLSASTFKPPIAISSSEIHIADIYSIDIDGDGDLDRLNPINSSKISWSENDGNENFTSHPIYTIQGGVNDLRAADIDRDGDVDLISVTSSQGTILWLENDGSQNFIIHTITSSLTNASSIEVYDINADGLVDIVSSSDDEGIVVWYQNQGNGLFQQKIISSQADGIQDVVPYDFDNDGDVDFVAGFVNRNSNSLTEIDVAWYVNTGDDLTFELMRISVSSGEDSSDIELTDVDSDGDIDVISTSNWHGNKYLYEGTYNVSFYPSEEIVYEESESLLTYIVNSDAFSTSVRYIPFIVSGIANYGIDYYLDGQASFDGSIGILEIPPNETTAYLYVIPIDDTVYELDESVTVTLLDGDYLLAGAKSISQYISSENEFGGDLGDAPSPYPTLLEDNGAGHNQPVSLGPRLGELIDYEGDGQPASNSDADLGDDAVSFGSIMTGQLDATVVVNLQGGLGKLDAWIDFNGDGSWGGPGEQIFASRDLLLGDNLIAFDVPSWATSGTTYARFRVSTSGGLGINGIAADGEVEDYEVLIQPPLSSQGGFIDGVIIDSQALGAADVFAADLDQDGDMDVISASQESDSIIWYENDGNQNYTPHFISDSANGAVGIYVDDLDGDGDLDVLSASFDDNRFQWFENDGNLNFQSHIISSSSGAIAITTADMDQDGDLDIVTAAAGSDRIAWHENDGHQSFTTHVVATWMDFTTSVEVADVDKDGDLDLLATSQSSDNIIWFENDGHQDFTYHYVASDANGVRSAFAVDLDGDNDLDIVSASRFDDTIHWFENDGDENFTERIVATSLDGAWDVSAADYDGDGDLDLLSASRDANSVILHENDGSQVFTSHIISENSDGIYSIFLADADNDGDLDIFSASTLDNRIVWYENASGANVTSTNSSVEESSSLPLVFSFSSTAVATEAKLLRFEISGDARYGIDYTLDGASAFDGVFGSIEIPAGSNSVQLLAFPIDDSLSEIDESVSVLLLGGALFVTEENSAIQYIVSEEFGADLGDAPAPYPTLTKDRGAFHSEGVVEGPRLGVANGFDVEGQPSLSADADISDDGVTFSQMHLAQLDASITIDVQGASGKVDAWIDFNGDGKWTHQEQILLSQDVSIGTHTFFYEVPILAKAGVSYARVRISSEGELDPTGGADDGEVEDYQFELMPLSRTYGGFTTEEQILDGDHYYENFNFELADLDGDFDHDIVVSAEYQIIWHENLGNGFYSTQVIQDVDYSKKLIIDDVDGDFDKDIVVLTDTSIIWLENDGSQFFSSHLLTENQYQDIAADDFNNDGSLDIVGLSTSSVSLFSNQTGGVFDEAIVADFTNENREFISLASGDIDGDGWVDLAIGGEWPNESLHGLFNDGRGQFEAIQYILNSSNPYSSSLIKLVDLDGDAQLEIISIVDDVHSDSFSWYQLQGRQVVNEFEIDRDAPVDFAAADFDGDGDIDLAAVFDRSYESAIWYENVGGTNFVSHDITTSYGYHNSIRIADLDADNIAELIIGTYDLFWKYSQEPLATVSVDLEIADESDEESIVFRVSIDSPIASPLEVPFTLSGIALPAVDYTVEGADSFIDSAGFITIPADVGFAELVIRPIEDGLVELSESITMTLNQGDIGDLPVNGQITTAYIFGDIDVADYGDAPSPYFTLTNENGPAHWAIGPQLGSTRTTEASGIASANSDGDSGDDGVTFHSLRIGEAGNTVTINVQNAPAGAILSGWIDFNADGSWRGPQEQVFANLPVVEGANELIFAIPGDTRPGATYARFRLSTEGNLSDTGPALDGEVEDYQIDIQPPASGFMTFGQFSSISDSTFLIDSKAIDFDKDGDIDIVGIESYNSISLLENDGNDNYLKRTLITDAEYRSSFAIADMDADGDYDVIFNDIYKNILWYENIDGELFSFHLIDTDFNRFNTSESIIEVSDINGDGNPDILFSGTADDFFTSTDFVYWYESIGSGEYLGHEVVTDTGGIRNAKAVDIDSDGDIDILSNGNSQNSFIWYENDGYQSYTPNSVVSTGLTSSTSNSGGYVRTADLDGDGDLDILPTPTFVPDSSFDRFGSEAGLLVWYENNEGLFIQHQITSDAEYASDVVAADFDADGDLDLIYSSEDYFRSQPALIYENLIIGDYNKDGEVSEGDYSFWKNHYGVVSGFGLQADGNNDGLVDAADYTIWRDHLSKPATRTFRQVALESFPVIERDFQAEDINGDGSLDLLSNGIWFANIPLVTVSQSGNTLSETGAEIVIAEFSLNKPLSYDLQLSIDLSGTAISTADYSALGADVVSSNQIFVTLPAGEVSTSIHFIALDDSLSELDEYFDFRITGGEAYVVTGATEFQVSVLSDEHGGDFGDAPNPYATLFIEDGASHSQYTVNDIRIGSTRSTTADGNPSTHAAGDSTDDGVLFGTMQAGQLGAQLIVNIEGVDGFLDAWIDFNGDGSWGGVGERIASGAFVSTGINTFSFNVPADAFIGQAFARIRVNSQGAIGPQGNAADGEVEDYLVTLKSANSFDIAPISTHLVTGDANGADGIFAVDMDFDGDQDLVSASQQDDTIAWYENDGNTNFTRHLITTLADSARSVIAADLDNDGDIDLAAVSSSDDELYWYRNDGSQDFSRIYISRRADGPTSVYASDIDGDGYLDLLTSSNSDGEIAWYRNGKNGTFGREIITSEATGATSVFAIDVNQDGDIDVLSSAYNSDTIAWHENDGNGHFTPHVVADTADGAQHVQAGDIDGDGDIDIVSASYLDNRVIWYENDGNLEFTARIITEQAIGAKKVRLVDFNGDGYLDALVASGQDNSITWYENDSNQNFTAHVISTTVLGVADVIAADLNGDGVLEAVSSSTDDDRIAWYEYHLPGDFDRNSLVDKDDHMFWAGHYGAVTFPGLQADGNADGIVDAADYTIWRDSFEKFLVESATVPEGTTLVTHSIQSLASTSEIEPKISQVTNISPKESAPDADVNLFDEIRLSIFLEAILRWSVYADVQEPEGQVEIKGITNKFDTEKNVLLLLAFNDFALDKKTNTIFNDLDLIVDEEREVFEEEELHNSVFASFYVE